MRNKIFFYGMLVAACGILLAVATSSGSGTSEIDKLLHQAETLVRVGVVDKGAGRSFAEARGLVDTARVRLAQADLPPAEAGMLSLELEAVEENLNIFTELYQERFYGVYPLARLLAKPAVKDEGFAFTEQLYHPPDEAAVNRAMEKLLDQIDGYRHPHVVITSQPQDRELENIVLEILLRDGHSTPVGRRVLVRTLSDEDLAAFDRGAIDTGLVDRLLTALNAVSLVVLTVEQPVELDNTTVRMVRGEYYTPGEVIQGSSVDASLIILSESFDFFGFAQDRRAQSRLIGATQLLFLLLAIVCAALVPWGIEKPLKIFYKLCIGALLFFFGRFFNILVLMLLRKILPEPTAMAAAVWWWPALLGLLAIIGAGLVAWIGQARLTDIVPGARGQRAVGAIFALVALGTCSHFVSPLLLLDEARGLANVAPFVLASVSLAVLFGFAARTGPPVPHYFMVAPLLLAPMTGVCLLMASPKMLWVMVGLTAVFCLAAWARHRVALAHGTEEPEPSPEEAAQADQQVLVKLSQKLLKKL